MDLSQASTLPSMIPDIHLLAYRNEQPTPLKLVNILPFYWNITAILLALLYFTLQLCFYFQYIKMVKL